MIVGVPTPVDLSPYNDAIVEELRCLHRGEKGNSGTGAEDAAVLLNLALDDESVDMNPDPF